MLPDYSRGVDETLRLGFTSLESELDGVELEVRGAVPPEVRGTLYRIGPARLGAYGERYRHWFCGDGMVHAFTFEGGRVRYRNRFVQTRGKLEEDAARRRIHATFGTQASGNALARLKYRFKHHGAKNGANTHVVRHAGRLLALWEGGRPYRIDPETLETLGEEDFGGVLGAKDTFSAHPRIDSATGELWNFGIEHGGRPRLNIYRLGADGVLEKRAKVDLPYAAMIHDCALTPARLVVALSPYTLPTIPVLLMLGQVSYGQQLRWRPQLGLNIMTFDRRTGEVRWFRTDPLLTIHLSHAFDDGADVVLDACAYPDADIMQTFVEIMAGELRTQSRSWMERLRLRADGRVTRERLSPTTLEFPRVEVDVVARPNKLFGVSWGERSPFASVPAAIDTQTGAAQLAPEVAGDWAGECVPVPRGPGAEPWVLTLVLNTAERRSELRVLDGADLKAPPAAVIPLPHVVPMGFHGSWVV
jgi:all-trans-8'-apo-beta-carotenal 15,15'-oxygenase